MSVGIVKLAGFTLNPPPPPVPTVYSADTFNRANSASVGVTEVGGFAWAAIGGGGDVSGWSINTNRLQKASGFNPSGTPKAFCVNDGHADGHISAVLVSAGVTSGIVFREAGDGSGGWLVDRTAAGLWRVRRHTGTTYTDILPLTSSLGTAGNDLVDIYLTGSAIQIKVNGATIYSGTDATHATNTRHGFWIAGTSLASHDNWLHEEILP